MVSTMRCGTNGRFMFNDLDSAKYILLVEHPKYVIHSRLIQIQGDINLEKLYLFQKKQLLKKVIIKNRQAIVVKGDTVSFVADSFATKAGDVVEDLIKLLPGMQVDAEGNITNQGKKVDKVLVNGEEFFGTDPTIATQNLPSKAVDKVEVYDAKDAQEEFTGFTADKDTKVINLKLKKEMSKGFFGKVNSAGGANDRWQQSLLLNKFNDKEQLGGYYLSNSNGMARMGWEDRQSYGGTATGGGGYNWSPFGSSAPNGITKSWKTGGRYANKFEKNNQELNISYGNSRFKRERSSRSYTENLLPENTFFKSDTSTSTNFNMTHAITARYKTDIDSFLKLNYNFRVSVSKINEESRSSYYNVNEEDALISFNNREANKEGINTNISNRVTLNRKFRKKGRTVSLRMNHTLTSNESDGFTQSENALNLINGGDKIILDQKRRIDNSNRTFGSTLVYTEPLSEKLRLKVSYNFNDNKNKNQNSTLDTVGFSSGTYINQLDSLSNIFSSRQITHKPGFVLRYENEKWRTSIGTDINFTNFEQFDLLRNNDFSYRQTNYIPRANLQYKFTKYRKISLGYNGWTTMPQANQLQPFQDNTNPLSIVIGNPNLKMGYTHNATIRYNSSSRVDGSYFNIDLSVRNGINRIGTNRIFSESGQTITTYINLPNNYGSWLWGYWSKKISRTKFRYNIRTSGSYDYSPNVINSIDGFTERIQGIIDPTIRYNNNELLSFSLGFETRYTQNRNSGNLNRTVQYFSYAPSASLSLFLPQFITISNNFSYEYQPIVEPYNEPFSRAIMKSSISKQFLAKKNLMVKFEVFDLFNQNRGYSRTNDVNYNTEQFYMTLGRYWMIGATWNFFSGPTAVKKRGSSKKEKSGQGWFGKKKRKDDKKENKKGSNAPAMGGEVIIIND